MRHRHAELIHAWAEGAKIERLMKDCVWVEEKNPCWAVLVEYRIKPKKPQWYEDIPAHGVLCWVSDKRSNPSSDNALRIITARKSDCFEGPGATIWRFATPLTDDEIKQFLRGDK